MFSVCNAKLSVGHLYKFLISSYTFYVEVIDSSACRWSLFLCNQPCSQFHI